jgi:hypothetical protein
MNSPRYILTDIRNLMAFCARLFFFLSARLPARSRYGEGRPPGLHFPSFGNLPGKGLYFDG